MHVRSLTILWLMLAVTGTCFSQKEKDTATAPEILYNGIRLSPVWPPAASKETPAEVPYLKNIPDIIPVNTGRQLFTDDFLIEQTDLVRVFHQAQKYAGNPVFKAETVYELDEKPDGTQSAVTYLGHGGVFYDPVPGEFKMFYTAGWRGGLAMATSKNLVNWQRPNLGIAGNSNLLLPPGKYWAGGDNAVWLDLNAVDTRDRIKFLTNRGAMPPHEGRHTLHTSYDGKIWSQGMLTSGKAGDYSSFFYNPFRNVWVFSIKRSDAGPRARDYAESKQFMDGADWKKNAVPWAAADSLDTPDPVINNTAELYSLNAVAYESILLGEFYIHLGPSNRVAKEGRFPKITEIKLGFSRDGFHWDRPDRSVFIGATRKEGDWDRGYVHGTTGVCLVMGDTIWFPYCAYSGISPNGTRGMYTGASVGMATLRRDGFASMEAMGRSGSLVTRKLSFTGRYLFVNVDCPDGMLQVDILDENDRVIQPYTAADCKVIRTDKTLYRVEWHAAADLQAIAGKPVKLRFHLTNGKLYSFWISKDESGASYGYVGAGGPGFEGVVDTKGIHAY